MRRILLAAGLALAASTSGFAREATEADKATVADRAAGFAAVFTNKTYGKLIDYVPPKIFEAIATQSGRPVGDVRAAAADQMKGLEAVEFRDMSMDVEGATYAETSSGRSYALIPTRATITASGQTMKFESTTVAIEDEGAWYLVRIDDPSQTEILQRAMPDFEGIEFPEGRIETVE